MYATLSVLEDNPILIAVIDVNGPQIAVIFQSLLQLLFIQLVVYQNYLQGLPLLL